MMIRDFMCVDNFEFSHFYNTILEINNLIFSGKCYGCIVRKKVLLLEELKRDTPEFGGFGWAPALPC